MNELATEEARPALARTTRRTRITAVIVASALKHGGSWWNEVDPERVAAFMDVVGKARDASA